MNPTDLQAAELAQDHVNGERLLEAISSLASFGGRDDGGVSRQTLTEVDLASRRYLIDQARSMGCEVGIDECANLFFRRPGLDNDLPPVLTGSHADTQPVGGTLDGAYGVIAGLEVIAALNDAGIQTLRPIEVVAWTNEEGSRFGPGTMGSSAFVEPARLAEYRGSRDGDGISFGEALDSALAAVSDVPRLAMARPMASYVELHIEQGPILEAENVPLGVVDGIQSVRWYRVECQGTMAHAGTTPMDRRNDAMATAHRVAQRLYEFAAAEAATQVRLTLGRWLVEPNSVNTIPGRVEFTIDVRCVDEAVLDRFEAMLNETINTQVASPATVTATCFFRRASTKFPEHMQRLVEKACTRAATLAGRKLPITLTSGAFHDAMYLVDHCPTSMIFVPSIDGVSHNASEATAPDDLVLGAQALAYTVAALASS
ncbi:MAG TPA: M20 family metallo-hydrolase [Burkholderiaceae bacterium]|nr:M20 family metallo-hydrolase [Burkholderiaceae bacterium]